MASSAAHSAVFHPGALVLPSSRAGDCSSGRSLNQYKTEIPNAGQGPAKVGSSYEAEGFVVLRNVILPKAAVVSERGMGYKIVPQKALSTGFLGGKAGAVQTETLIKACSKHLTGPYALPPKS